MSSSPVTDQVTIRPRVTADLPALADALMAQQAETRYPFRNPLPFPVEEFLHAHDAAGAWTADLHGRPVGHACRTDLARATGADVELNLTCARAHGCEVTDLTWVGALFVAREARGLGIGRRLLDTVVEDAHTARRHPAWRCCRSTPARWRCIGRQAGASSDP